MDKGKAKRSKEEVMKILKREAWSMVGPDAKGFLTEHRMEKIANQIIALMEDSGWHDT